jgi:hypothetical protein
MMKTPAVDARARLPVREGEPGAGGGAGAMCELVCLSADSRVYSAAHFD